MWARRMPFSEQSDKKKLVRPRWTTTFRGRRARHIPLAGYDRYQPQTSCCGFLLLVLVIWRECQSSKVKLDYEKKTRAYDVTPHTATLVP